jgi:Domain of unknown function (DUF4234)
MNLREVNGVEVKERNPFGVWALTIVTLGIYYLVWYYKINKEMRRAYGIDVDPAMAVVAITLGTFIVVPPFVSIYRTGRRVEQSQFHAGVRDNISPVLTLVLSVLFGLHIIYLQYNLNKAWDRGGRALPPGQAPGLQAPPAAAPPPSSQAEGEGGPPQGG